ncbi:MAG TPA: RNA polymerase sigma factor [Candidatus Paceibacterota bacterium]|nr:RNA polymerase sigma factor [Candidatus Paceibacterota bacterium]
MTKAEFSQIYYSEIDKIFRFFFLRVNSIEEAEDLTSLVFLKFYQSFQKKGEKTVVDKKSFLYKMARNLLVDFYRKKDRNSLSLDKLFEEGFDLPSPNEIENRIELDFQMEEIKKALKEINPLYADVIILHYIDDLSVKELAVILNKKENNVRVLIHRALDSLKSHLAL